MNLIPSFPTMTDVYEEYTGPHQTIIFEGRTYKFVRTIRLNDVTKHVYRNEEEQHTVCIHMNNGVPFYVDAFYSIQEVS